MLLYHKVTEEEKYLISEWKYREPYSIYNNIPYTEQIQKHRGFADLQNNYYSYYDGEKLVGYVNLKEKESNVFLGVGVNPEFCDQGYGQQIVKMACILSHKQYPNKKVSIEVRSWNIRAIKCYEKVGFVIVGMPVIKITPMGPGEFYNMEESCQQALY